jgi:hypothetical protein
MSDQVSLPAKSNPAQKRTSANTQSPATVLAFSVAEFRRENQGIRGIASQGRNEREIRTIPIRSTFTQIDYRLSKYLYRTERLWGAPQLLRLSPKTLEG